LARAALEHRAQRHEDLALEPLGLDLARPLDRLQAEDVADDRHHQSTSTSAAPIARKPASTLRARASSESAGAMP
jgi:hypothetical protein